MKRLAQESRAIDRSATTEAKRAIPVPVGGPAPCLTTTDQARAVDKPPALASRIVDLISAEPIDRAIASLGLVTVFLLSEAGDPLQALDDLSAKLRGFLIAEKREDELERLVH